MGDVVLMRAPNPPVLPEDVSYMAMAYLLGCQSPCARGHVGALAVRDGQIVASGFNKPGDGRCYGAEACGALEGCTRSVSAAQNLLDNAAPGVLQGATVYISMPPPRAQYEALLTCGVVRIVAGPLHHRAHPDDRSGSVAVELVEHEPMALRAIDALLTDHLPRRLRPVSGERFGRLVPPLPASHGPDNRRLALRRLDALDSQGEPVFALYGSTHALPSLSVSLSELVAWGTWLSMPPHIRFWQTEVVPFSLLTSVSTGIQAIRTFTTPPVIFLSQQDGALALDIWSIPKSFVRPATRAQAEALYEAYTQWAHTHRAALMSQQDEHIDFVPPEAPGRLPGPWSRSRAQRMLNDAEPILWMAPRTTKLSEEAKEMLRRDYGTDIGATWAATLAELEHLAGYRLEYIVDPPGDETVAWAVAKARELAQTFEEACAAWAAHKHPGQRDEARAQPNTVAPDAPSVAPAQPGGTSAPRSGTSASDVFGGAQ